MFWKQDTVEAIDTAFIKQIRDTVDAAVEQTQFERVVELMIQAREAKLNSMVSEEANYLDFKKIVSIFKLGQ